MKFFSLNKSWKKPYGIFGALAVVACFLIIAAASVTAAPDAWTPDTKWYYDYKTVRGTKENPFIISTPEELAGLAELSNKKGTWMPVFHEEVFFKGKHIILARDIDLQGKEWSPIGWKIDYRNVPFGMGNTANYKGFDGTFDGGGHTVSGLSMSTGDGVYMFKEVVSETAGLFGYISLDGTVKNLRVKGTVKSLKCEAAGGVAGWADGKIENCVTDVDVYALSEKRGYVGGIAGLNGGPQGENDNTHKPNPFAIIRNCVTLGNVTSTPGSFSYGGGVVGFSSWYKGVVTNCSVESKSILAAMDAGGIFGGFNSAKTQDSVSVAESIKASPGHTSGIVGAYGFGYQNCYWLKVNKNQPDFGNSSMGITDYGKITDPSKIPVTSAVIDSSTVVTMKPGQEKEIRIISYPLIANASHLTYNWTVDASRLEIISGQGTSALTVKAKNLSGSDAAYASVSAAVHGLLGHTTKGDGESAVHTSNFDTDVEIGAILKITQSPIAVTSVVAYGDSAPLDEGGTRIISAAINPSDADNRAVSWALTSTSGVGAAGDIAMKENKDGSLSVTLRKGHEKDASYTFTVTTADGALTSSLTLAAAQVKDIDINGVIPAGDAVPLYAGGVKPSGAKSATIKDIVEETGSSYSEYRSNQNGVLFISTQQINAAKADVEKKEKIAITKVSPLPVMQARTKQSGKLAATALVVSGEALMAETPEKIRIIQTNPNGTGELFAYADDTDAIGNKRFALQTMDDILMKPNDPIDPAKQYKLVLYIQDNGTADLAPAEKQIITAVAIVKTSDNTTPASGGSGGGCNGGFGALLLLALVPLAAAVRKKKL